MGLFRNMLASVDSTQSLRDKGDAARDVRNWQAAIGLYTRYLERVPEDAAIWVQLGHAQKESGDPSLAERSYRQALSIEPGNPDTYVQLGHVMKLIGNIGEAVAHYRKALELDTDFPAALQELVNHDADHGTQYVRLASSSASDNSAITLKFSRSMMVEGRNFDVHHGQREIKLEVSGIKEVFDCIVFEGRTANTITPDVVHIDAVLPGYIWRDRGPEEDSVVRLLVDGLQVGGALTLTRQDVIKAIDGLAATSKPESAVFEALSALEHVKYGLLFEQLSPTAKTFIRNTVALFKLDDYLELPEIEPQAAWMKEKATKSIAQLLGERIRKEFALGVRSTPSRDPAELLRGLIDKYFSGKDLTLQVEFKGDLLVSLAEYFCQIDNFEPLFELWWLHTAGRTELKTGQNWDRSLAMPFLLKLGQQELLASVMSMVTKNPNDWINTACIAWTLKAALRSDKKQWDRSQLLVITRTFMDLVDAHAVSYWSRSPCANLIDASAALLLSRHVFPQDVNAAITSFALRCYGLSPQFWRAVDAAAGGAGAPHLGAEIDAGRAACRVIQAYVEAASPANAPTRAEVEVALLFFVNCKAHDVARMRLEILGPSGIIDPGQPPHLKLMAQGYDVSEALLRHLAFPGAPELPVSLAQSVRNAVRERIGNVVHSPNRDLIRQVVSRAHGFLKNLERRSDAAAAADELEQIFSMLYQSSDKAWPFVDLAIGLALYTDVLGGGHEEIAPKPGVFLLSRLSALSQADRKALRSNVMLRSVYSRFAIIAERSGSSLALSLHSQLEQRTKLPLRQPPEPLKEMEALWYSACGLFDTLVLVYSCRANLETRVQEIRKSWLGKVAELGVPYLIVVGDGKDEVIGDVLYVNAPDTYEGLPQKSVRMLQWVERHSRFAHVFKIDDDCFLDAEEFFYTWTYRKFNFYGRQLRRELGSKPRMWHMSRSATRRGKLELDKSSEPAVYLDGGCGYTLSRDALIALSTSLASPEGRRLTHVSYSEDKLVGDLLQLQGINPRSSDYLTAVMRSTHAGGRPIMQWENTFFPSVMSGIKVAHMDRADELVQRAEEYARGTLSPKKIWPTTGKVKLSGESGTLELISSNEKLAVATAAPVAVASVVRNELLMLPHFLTHYRKLGVASFLIVDNCSDDGTLEYLAEQPDVALFSAAGSFRAAAQGTDWKHAMMAQFRLGKWTLVADADELLLYRDYETRSLEAYLGDPAFAEADAFLTLMVDMYPKGSLSMATFESGDLFSEAGYVDRQPLLRTSLGRGRFATRLTRTSGLRHRLFPGSRPELFVSEKVALLKYKPWMKISVSMHYVADVKLATSSMLLAHFKYNAEFRARALREIKRGQYFNNAEEYKKYMEIITEGQDVLYDPDASIPWRECEEICEILGGAASGRVRRE